MKTLPFVRFTSALLTIALTSAVYANPMTQEQIDLMMRGMAQMQNCFAQLDPAKLDALGKEAEAAEATISQLCAAGKRDEAQQAALQYGQTMLQSQEFEQLRACGEQAAMMMPGIMSWTEEGDEDTHVCDSL